MSDDAAQRASVRQRQRAHGSRTDAVLAALLCALALPAAAQSTIPYATNGLLIGEGRLHAYFGLEARFDSAAGFFSSDSGTAELQGELLWFLRPGLRFELPGEMVNFNAGGHLEYVAYSGLLTSGSSSANRLQASADAGLSINDSGPISVVLSDVFRRNDRTQNLAVGFGVLSLHNTASIKVPIRPGGGALEITPGGSFGIEYLSPLAEADAITGCTDPSCDPSQVAQFNSQVIGASLDARWSFLPRTALIFNSGFQQTDYPQGATPATSMLNGTVGLAGQLTQRLAVVANVGWSQNLGELGGGTVIGLAELRFPPTPSTQISVGYQRRLQAVALYGTARNDRVYVKANARFREKLILGLEGAYNWLAFEGGVRNDALITASATVDYEVLPWFLVGGGYRLELRDSTVSASSLNLARHEVMATLTVRY